MKSRCPKKSLPAGQDELSAGDALPMHGLKPDRSELRMQKEELREAAEMVRKYVTKRGFRIIRALDQVAKQLNSKPACVALAWLIARPGITAPIASASNLEQMDDLINATKLELDHASLRFLDKESAY